MSHVTTHVLDTAGGRPAAGIHVALLFESQVLGEGVTDEDGRVRELGPERLAPGIYELHFTVEGPFYPRVTIAFFVADESHYHVPLLLSPYSYSTYRGS